MKEKIKNFFDFVKSAWMAGPRGRWGIIFMILAVFFFVRLFFGTQNIQGFIINAWHLNHERIELAESQKQLQKIQHHIYLLQHPNSSSDYIFSINVRN